MELRQTKLRKYLETTVNILLVVVCFALLSVVVKNYFLSPLTSVKSAAVGDRISFPDSVWTNG